MLFNLFSKKTAPAAASAIRDYADIKVDLHSHLIPGIDDGSQSLEESIALILELKKLGYQKLITTPHIMSDYYRNTPEIILSGLELVKNELKNRGIDMKMEAAAEYYFDEYFLSLLQQNKNIIAINNEYVLFELSYLNKPQGVLDAIFAIQQLGYKPLMAHPERYPYLSVEEYTEFKEKGCLFQMNLLSIGGFYGKSVKLLANQLIDLGMVDMVGTDLHRMKHAEQLHYTLESSYLEKLFTEKDLLNPTLL